MKRKHVHRLFVERDGNLVGVISTMDLLGALSAPVRRVAVGT
jgi:signal-transduction protein with cAMP-binding, CBS, and nucleotidyltransferase domain